MVVLSGLSAKPRMFLMIGKSLWYEHHFFVAHMNDRKSSGSKTNIQNKLMLNMSLNMLNRVHFNKNSVIKCVQDRVEIKDHLYLLLSAGC